MESIDFEELAAFLRFGKGKIFLCYNDLENKFIFYQIGVIAEYEERLSEGFTLSQAFERAKTETHYKGVL